MEKNFFDINREDILKKLNNSGFKLKCPVCDCENMILPDGYFVSGIQKEIKNISIGGQILPTVPLVCSKCGYVREFSLGVLGFLPKE